MRNAISSVFPLVDLLGCFFHFSQQVIKRMNGCQTQYGKNYRFNAFIRRCCSLPFVPRHLIHHAMNVLEKRVDGLKESPEEQKFSSNLLEYIQRTWIEGSFSVQDWNLFEVDCQVIPTTNNGNEAGNSRLNQIFSVESSSVLFKRFRLSRFLEQFFLPMLE